MDSNEIILDIEGQSLICNKEDLIMNSDYFKAMLQGNFIESNKKCIKLEGVEAKSMDIILKLLHDKSLVLPPEDSLPVLQAASMLQFVQIKEVCIERVKELLTPANAVKTWLLTEQLDIKPLYLHAKYMALNEFMQIKDTDIILDLTQSEITNYLGHITLACENEILVFQAAMKWWYENNEQFTEDRNSVIIKLLLCLDFTSLSDSDIKEMMTYPDIKTNSEVTDILNCVLHLRAQQNINSYSENCLKIAEKLNHSTSRVSLGFPCILVDAYTNLSTIDNPDDKVFVYDKFKRKRPYKVLNCENDDKTIIYYDYVSKKFKKLFDIDSNKCRGLDGFKLMSYKEFVFMYGGEFQIGKGNWNHNFWVFDAIKEKWERKSKMPFPRRHFETYIVGSCVFIIGGTGVFRVIRENMFWYDFKEDKWSTEIMLPSPGRQLKCCKLLNELFVLNINNKCGYFFNQKTLLWIKMEIIDSNDKIMNKPDCTIFSFKDSLYIKGTHLLELVVKDKQLVIASEKFITDISYDKIESVLCNHLLYTLYKHKFEDMCSYSLEEFDLINNNKRYIFENTTDVTVDVNGLHYAIDSTLKIFPFQHHSLVEKNNLVNSYCEDNQ